jgi:hypothetical protein
MRLRNGVVLIFVVYVICICVSATTQTGANRSKPAAPIKINPCALLTSAEIQAVQGERIEEFKTTNQPSGSVTLHQCTFRTTTPSKSVSLAVATAGALLGSEVSPRQFWQQKFHSADQGEQREREGGKPRHISVLGEEAFWINTPVTGALYVLQGDTFFRISVGGVPQETERLARSKTLATKVANRLMHGWSRQAIP